MKPLFKLFVLGLLISVSTNKLQAVIDTSNVCYVDFDYYINYAVDYYSPAKTAVQFKNFSKGVDLKYTWKFDDGDTSTEMNPLHMFELKPQIAIYPAPPFSKTCLNIKSNICNKSICKDLYYNRDTSIKPSCTPSFYYKDISDMISSMKYREDSSIRLFKLYGKSEYTITEWKWQIGDSIIYGQDIISDIHAKWSNELKAFGEKVTLTTTTKEGCTASYSEFVSIISNQIQCSVKFTYTINDSLNRDDSVMFRFYGYSNQSVLSWNWKFSDGTTSTLQNPVHFIPNARYLTNSKCGPNMKCLIINDVCLTISTANGCTNTYCQEVNPIVYPPINDCNAKFEYNMSKSNPPIYTFNNLSTWKGGSVYWDFGDGTYSYEESQSHVFQTKPGIVYDTLKYTLEPLAKTNYINSNLSSIGNYNVCLTIYDYSGCKSNYCQTIPAQPNPSGTLCDNYIKLTTSSILGLSTCNGTANAILTNSKGETSSAIQVYWSNGESGSSAKYLCDNTIYSVKVVDNNGCVASGSFAIYDYANPWVYPGSWIYKGTQNDYSFTFTPNSNQDYTVKWKSSDGIVQSGNTVSYKFDKATSNWVDMEVYDKNIKLIYQERINIDGLTTVNNASSVSNFSIYPIPAASEVNIELKSTIDGKAEIVDLTGRVIASANLLPNKLKSTINIENLNKGIYICRIVAGGKTLYSSKIIKQ
jgi:hypothetical protein